MTRDDAALDGLLRELARAPEGDDAFVRRVMDRAERRPRVRVFLAGAAASLILLAAGFLLEPPPTARIRVTPPACLRSETTSMRVVVPGRSAFDPVPVDALARVPAGVPLLLQAVGADGMALWTSPSTITLRPREIHGDGPAATPAERRMDYTRDVKPILDAHCAECHTEAELVAAAKPYQARRSPVVTQTHAPVSAAERGRLALWVDLGASTRP
ncbi:MAG TPA: hypothetical protein VE981_02150 [Planctomycetota bacterium]|nr:hypothetical protein [Planctomycetota bacterium]